MNQNNIHFFLFSIFILYNNKNMGCGFSKSDVVDFISDQLDSKQQSQQQQQQQQTQSHQQNQQHHESSHVTSSGGGGGGGGEIVVGGGLSPIYKQLPSGATKESVRNVYDGDTLTLIDERRVRFLGVDAPEVKENQPFAYEAKEYTKNHCTEKVIWLVFEEKSEREDKYGRLLAYVYVKNPSGGYLCLNEGLISSGFAAVYTPDKATTFNTMKKMLQQQKSAREKKVGMWKSFHDKQVITTSHGAAYHDRSCKFLSNSRNVIEMKASEAMDKGLHPCRECQS